MKWLKDSIGKYFSDGERENYEKQIAELIRRNERNEKRFKAEADFEKKRYAETLSGTYRIKEADLEATKAGLLSAELKLERDDLAVLDEMHRLRMIQRAIGAWLTDNRMIEVEAAKIVQLFNNGRALHEEISTLLLDITSEREARAKDRVKR